MFQLALITISTQ